MTYHHCDGGFGREYGHNHDFHQQDMRHSHQARGPSEAQHIPPPNAPCYQSGQSSYSSSSSDYIARPAYSKADYIVPSNQAKHHSERKTKSYTSRHSTSDYISPPADSREDYIAPQKHTTHHRRRTSPAYQKPEAWETYNGLNDARHPSKHQSAHHRQRSTSPVYHETNKRGNNSYAKETVAPPHDFNTGYRQHQHPFPPYSHTIATPSQHEPDTDTDTESIAPKHAPHNSKRHTRHTSPSPAPSAYGSDFATLVDSSASDSSTSLSLSLSSSPRLRRTRRHRRDSDVVSLPHSRSRSPSPSPSPSRPASPSSNRPSPPFISARSRSQRSAYAGSDVASVQQASDVELWGSDCVDVHGERDVESDVCSVELRGRRSDVESSGEEGRWDDEDTVEMSSEEEEEGGSDGE